MPDNQDVIESLENFSPATRAWFTAVFAAPTQAQAQAWTAIGKGEDTLVIAPTGSGKTLAAFLWALDRLAAVPAPADPKRRCRVLYVSPLKALATDIERNLRAPLTGIRHAARNLGLAAQVPHEERYQVAEEFLEVCYKLWESSWEDGAVLRDKTGGIFADPGKVHPIGHQGQYFTVPGLFLCEPSPQRTPLLFQAGSSASGLAFAARHAEAIFFSETRPDVLRPKVARLRAQAERGGRDPRSLTMCPLMTVITAPTDSEARAKLADYEQYASYEGALALYGGWSGLDLSGYDPDQPLRYVQTEAVRSAGETFTTADPAREWTPREIARFVGIGGRGPVVVGSPATVADEMERWIAEADVDGFNLAYAITPGTFEDIVEHLVPELQDRGLLRTAYEGTTLRENLYGKGQARLRDDHPGARYRTTYGQG